jgi:hypothetical protein
MAKLTIVIFIAISVFASNAYSRPRNYASLSVGKTSADRDVFYDRELESGTNLGGALGFDFAPYTGAEVLFEQHWSGESQSGIRAKLKMIMFLLKFRPIVIRDRYVPYALIGGGYVRSSFGSQTENGDGYFFGIGSEFWMLSRLGLFIEWKTGKVKFSNYDGNGNVIKLGVLAGF